MSAPVGAVVTLTLDLDGRARHGDIIETGTTRRYMVIEGRAMRSKYAGRQRVTCIVLGEQQPTPPLEGCRTFQIRWYNRGKRRRR